MESLPFEKYLIFVFLLFLFSFIQLIWFQLFPIFFQLAFFMSIEYSLKSNHKGKKEEAKTERKFNWKSIENSSISLIIIIIIMRHSHTKMNLIECQIFRSETVYLSNNQSLSFYSSSFQFFFVCCFMFVFMKKQKSKKMA